MPKADENNFFICDKDLIKYIISFFKFKNIKIIKDDFLNIKRYRKNFNKFSLIYIDCDLYLTTKLILYFLKMILNNVNLLLELSF